LPFDSLCHRQGPGRVGRARVWQRCPGGGRAGAGGCLPQLDRPEPAAGSEVEREIPAALETGFVDKFNDFLTAKLAPSTGPLAGQISSINKANASIDQQIITLNQRLANQRELLTSAFLSMQNAQSRAQQQQTTLSNFFDKKTSS